MIFITGYIGADHAISHSISGRPTPWTLGRDTGACDLTNLSKSRTPAASDKIGDNLNMIDENS